MFNDKTIVPLNDHFRFLVEREMYLLYILMMLSTIIPFFKFLFSIFTFSSRRFSKIDFQGIFFNFCRYTKTFKSWKKNTL